MEQALIFGVFLAGFGAVIGFGIWRDRKRREELQRIAMMLGFSFLAEDPDLLLLQGWRLFEQGRSRQARNVMRGRSQGGDTTIFDYRYTEGSGKSSHRRQQTVCLFADARFSLPNFFLRPEDLFDKVQAAFGFGDIDFPAFPRFSEQYVLQGDNENDVRRAFSDRALSHFAQSTGWSAEGRGTRLAVFRANQTVKPENIPSFLEECTTLASLFRR